MAARALMRVTSGRRALIPLGLSAVRAIGGSDAAFLVAARALADHLTAAALAMSAGASWIAAERTLSLAHSSYGNAAREVALQDGEGDRRQHDAERREDERSEIEGRVVVVGVVAGEDESDHARRHDHAKGEREIARPPPPQRREEHEPEGEQCEREQELRDAARGGVVAERIREVLVDLHVGPDRSDEDENSEHDGEQLLAFGRGDLLDVDLLSAHLASPFSSLSGGGVAPRARNRALRRLTAACRFVAVGCPTRAGRSPAGWSRR